MNFNPSKYNTIQISLVFKQMKEPIPPRTDCLHRKQPQSGKPQQTLKGNCHNWSLLDKQYGDWQPKEKELCFFFQEQLQTLHCQGQVPHLHYMVCLTVGPLQLQTERCPAAWKGTATSSKVCLQQLQGHDIQYHAADAWQSGIVWSSTAQTQQPVSDPVPDQNWVGDIDCTSIC